jgi:hypothetical protein
MRAPLFFLLATVAIVTMPAAAHHSHNNYAISEFTPLQGIVNQARRVLRRSN